MAACLSADLAEMLEQHGPAWVGRQLGMDDRCAPEGSGDDTTVALILGDRRVQVPRRDRRAAGGSYRPVRSWSWR